jgi:hypothetical protein
MNDDEDIATLKHEIAALRAELAEFRLMVMADSQVTAEHLIDQYARIDDIVSYLMPLLRRFYPSMAESEEALAAILKPPSAYPHSPAAKNRYKEILEGLKRDAFVPPKPIRDGDYG